MEDIFCDIRKHICYFLWIGGMFFISIWIQLSKSDLIFLGHSMFNLEFILIFFYC